MIHLVHYSLPLHHLHLLGGFLQKSCYFVACGGRILAKRVLNLALYVPVNVKHPLHLVECVPSTALNGICFRTTCTVKGGLAQDKTLQAHQMLDTNCCAKEVAPIRWQPVQHTCGSHTSMPFTRGKPSTAGQGFTGNGTSTA